MNNINDDELIGHIPTNIPRTKFKSSPVALEEVSKLGPHLMGKVDQAMIDWLNLWQPDTVYLLGSGEYMAYLLDNLAYKPTYAYLRLWWEHPLDSSQGSKMITPDNWNDMLPWARETSEYRVHKLPGEDLVLRPEFPNEWAEIWEPGTHIAQRCVQKWMAWTRNDWLAVKGRDNVYAIGFLAGLKGNQIVPEYFTFEQERIAAMWDGGLEGPHHIKVGALNFATGQYAPDKDFWNAPQFGSFASTLKAYPQTMLNFHAYCHMSFKTEHGDMRVTAESPELFPSEPYTYIRNHKVYPPDMVDTWAAFLPHKVYKEVLVPAGLGHIGITVTESGWDRVYKPSWPKMVEVYYRGQEPAGFWEYAYENPDWPISHWNYLKFLEPYLERAKGNHIEAAQWFAAFDLAWADLQDAVYPEIKGRVIYMGRTDGDASWANFNIWNAHLFPERVKQARAEIMAGTPAPAPPVAIIIGPDTAKVGESVTFTNASTGEITSVLWSYPLGLPAVKNSDQLKISFMEPGLNLITMYVEGPGGSDSITHTITIAPADEPPPEPKPTPAIRVIARIQFGKLSIGAWIE